MPSRDCRGSQQMKVYPAETCAPQAMGIEEIVDLGLAGNWRPGQISQETQRLPAVL